MTLNLDERTKIFDKVCRSVEPSTSILDSMEWIGAPWLRAEGTRSLRVQRPKFSKRKSTD